MSHNLDLLAQVAQFPGMNLQNPLHARAKASQVRRRPVLRAEAASWWPVWVWSHAGSFSCTLPALRSLSSTWSPPDFWMPYVFLIFATVALQFSRQTGLIYRGCHWKQHVSSGPSVPAWVEGWVAVPKQEPRHENPTECSHRVTEGNPGPARGSYPGTFLYLPHLPGKGPLSLA